MSSSQSNPAVEAKKLRFKILDALYNFSNGNKYFVVAFEKLYEHLLATNDNAQEPIRGALEYLNHYGLVESRALGTISIAHKGIKVYEEAILNPDLYNDFFPLQTMEMAFTESKKNEIRNIKNKRDAFLHEVYKLSGGRTTQIVSSSEVVKTLGIDSDTFQKILIYWVDEGYIKSLAVGGGILTITFDGIEQVEEDQPS